MQNPGFCSKLLVPDADDILQVVDGDLGVDFSHDNRGISQNLFGQIDILGKERGSPADYGVILNERVLKKGGCHAAPNCVICIADF